MLYLDYTEELTGLQEIIIEKIERTDLITTIHIKMERKPTKCPCCGELTDTIHDYRTQLVQEQKKYSTQYRKLFKNSKRILTKRYSKLNDAEKQRLNSVLYIILKVAA